MAERKGAQGGSAAERRAARLAEALRANLHRRKEHTRALAGSSEAEAPAVAMNQPGVSTLDGGEQNAAAAASPPMPSAHDDTVAADFTQRRDEPKR